jgi:hypothetical protein
MDHQTENDLSHRQEREHKKEEHKHPEPGMYLRSVHPAWFVIVAVIACSIAVLIWTFIVW